MKTSNRESPKAQKNGKCVVCPADPFALWGFRDEPADLTMINKLAAAAFVLVVALGMLGGYRMVRSQMTAEVYKQRLTQLTDEYETLRDRYNTAIRKTAVTELLVEDNEVCVVIRTAEGELKRIATPFPADSEIYVEYLAFDGRLWIRRVFNDRTPPEKGVVVEPSLAQVDWDSPRVDVGKTVSRRLAQGRWVITVTGDGSLGLAKATGKTDLQTAPPLGDFEPIDTQANAEVDGIGVTDVLRHAVAGE